jgi:hypothetical protein
MGACTHGRARTGARARAQDSIDMIQSSIREMGYCGPEPLPVRPLAAVLACP